MRKIITIFLLLFVYVSYAQKTLVSINLGEQMAKIPNTTFSKYKLKPGYGIGISGIYITDIGIYSGLNVSVSRLQVMEHTHYVDSWGTTYARDGRTVISFGQLTVDAMLGYSFGLKRSAVSIGTMIGYVGDGTREGLRYGLDARYTHEVTKHFALGLDCNALIYTGANYYYLERLASFGTYINFYWYF